MYTLEEKVNFLVNAGRVNGQIDALTEKITEGLDIDASTIELVNRVVGIAYRTATIDASEIMML